MGKGDAPLDDLGRGDGVLALCRAPAHGARARHAQDRLEALDGDVLALGVVRLPCVRGRCVSWARRVGGGRRERRRRTDEVGQVLQELGDDGVGRRAVVREDGRRDGGCLEADKVVLRVEEPVRRVRESAPSRGTRWEREGAHLRRGGEGESEPEMRREMRSSRSVGRMRRVSAGKARQRGGKEDGPAMKSPRRTRTNWSVSLRDSLLSSRM